ncbi:MAG: outer membrane beta-barrel protein [Flavobacteriales bacterium]
MRQLISSALLLLCLPVLAQDKGFVSGTIGFSSSKVDNPGSSDPTTNTFTFGPAVGYHLNASNVVGLALGFTSSRTVMPQTYTDINGNPIAAGHTDKENLFEVAPFYRYVKSVGDKFALYGQLKVGFGSGKSTTEYESIPGNSETKISTFRAGIGPGIVYAPATRWALSANWGLIGYHSRTEKLKKSNNDSKTTTSGFDATLNPGAITLALNWLF